MASNRSTADWRPRRFHPVGHPLDHRLEQVRFRAEVVVERALRGADLVDHVLDAEGLVATGLDEALRHVHEGVAPDRVAGCVEGSRHREFH
jgi:hypothetical protein